MQKTSALPAITEAIELLTSALDQGHSVVLSLAAPPRIHHPPPLVTTCCLTLGMTPSEARVLLALTEHGYAGRKDLHHAMSDGRGTSKIKTVDVVINRVRQKLAAHNVKIIAVWKSGYKLDEDDRDKLRKILNPTTNAGITESNMKPTTP
jgi:hypothetical protein